MLYILELIQLTGSITILRFNNIKVFFKEIHCYGINLIHQYMLQRDFIRILYILHVEIISL